MSSPAFWCLYKCLNYAITAEEGLKYSVPNMPAADQPIAIAYFREMSYKADMYGYLFLAFILLALLPVSIWIAKGFSDSVRILSGISKPH